MKKHVRIQNTSNIFFKQPKTLLEKIEEYGNTILNGRGHYPWFITFDMESMLEKAYNMHINREIKICESPCTCFNKCSIINKLSHSLSYLKEGGTCNSQTSIVCRDKFTAVCRN